jgi:uncharacterized membrane protein YqjE
MPWAPARLWACWSATWPRAADSGLPIVTHEQGGIVGDVRGVASGALRAVHTRLELLSIEIQEEKARIVTQLLLACATFFFLSFGMLLVILWLSFSLPEDQRPFVLGALGGIFVVVGGLCALRIKSLANGAQLFGATLEALKQDEKALEARHVGT